MSSSPPPYIVKQYINSGLNEKSQSKSLPEITQKCWQSLTTSEKDTVKYLSLNSIFLLLGQFLGHKPNFNSTTFTIVSSNAFLYIKDEVTLPAEIGISRFSFFDSQIQAWFGGYFDCSEEKVALKYHSQVAQSIDQHKIKLDAKTDYLGLAHTIEQIHQHVHYSQGPFGGAGWVFIEDSEFDQTFSVIEWCRVKSTELSLQLSWNYRCVPLGDLCLYLLAMFDIPEDCFDRAALFDPTTIRSSPTCSVHLEVGKAGLCAVAKVRHYAQVIIDKFTGQFKHHLDSEAQ